MAQMSKPLSDALKASTPENRRKMAQNCFDDAKCFEDAAKLLREAGEAFDRGDHTTAMKLLQHATDCLDQK